MSMIGSLKVKIKALNYKKFLMVSFKWIYYILNYTVRAVLLSLFLYAAVFSIVASYLLYKAFDYSYGLYQSVVSLKYDSPEKSRYMQALLDSNPNASLEHQFVPLDSISKHLQKAVIASEDAGFYFHPGFDVRAIAEALETNRQRGSTKFGGSTITQQLAKNLFLTGERSWDRKLKELIYSILMEKELGKDRIWSFILIMPNGEKIFLAVKRHQKNIIKKDALN